VKSILLAREDELWYLGPRASGFFPEKPDSIIEALEQ